MQIVAQIIINKNLATFKIIIDEKISTYATNFEQLRVIDT